MVGAITTSFPALLPLGNIIVIQLLVKVGNKRKSDDPHFDYDWRDGQIVNVRPGEYYRSAGGAPNGRLTCMHNCVIQLNGDFWQLAGRSTYSGLKTSPSQYLANLKTFTSPKYNGKHKWEQGYIRPQEIDALVRKRDWYVDFEALRDSHLITASQYESIMDKDRVHEPIILDRGLTDILHHEDVGPRPLVDRIGSETAGSFTVGTAQDYADWSDAEADIGTPLTGNLTFTGNTTEEITESTDIIFDTDTNTYTLKITVADANVHNGGAYGNGHRVAFTSSDSFIFDETTDGHLDDWIFEKMAIDAIGNNNTGVISQDGTNSGHGIIDRCVIVGDANSDSGIVAVSTSDNVIIRNNIVYGFTDPTPNSDEGNGISLRRELLNAFECYNNTCMNNSVGIGGWAATPEGNTIVRNNLCYGNSYGGGPTAADYVMQNGAFTTTSKNVSGDTTSPDGATYQNWAGTANMVDYDNNDYRLDTTDSTLDDGDDLSGIGAPAQFDYDIQGQTRTTWFIGASEFIASSSSSSSSSESVSSSSSSSSESSSSSSSSSSLSVSSSSSSESVSSSSSSSSSSSLSLSSSSTSSSSGVNILRKLRIYAMQDQYRIRQLLAA